MQHRIGMPARHRRHVQLDESSQPVHHNQTGDPPLRRTKVKLKLFDGSLMKPCGIATLKIHHDNTTEELDFRIVETVNKPLLFAETCVKPGLLKLSFTDTAH